MLIQLILVFVAFTQHCIQCNVLCIQGLSPLQEGRLIVAISPVGLAIQQSEEAACQTTRVIVGKMYSQSLILKNLGGAQQPGNSYISIGKKLHPPYLNQDCLPTVQILT